MTAHIEKFALPRDTDFDRPLSLSKCSALSLSKCAAEPAPHATALQQAPRPAVPGNYHTHTTYCDGKSTAREMAEAALAQGLQYLGFSAHSAYPLSSDWHLPVERFTDYCRELAALKAEYAGRLTILTGFEADYLPGVTVPTHGLYAQFSPDYLIGSVHFVSNERRPELPMFAVDGSEEEVAGGLAHTFGGDAKLLVQTYFSRERDLLAHGNFDVLAHADVIRRRNSALRFFDETEGWYRRELEATADAIARAGVLVEINTGGMARGNTTTPYPSLDFLTLLAERGVPAILNSDAHTAQTLTYAYTEALAHARAAGYHELHYFAK